MPEESKIRVAVLFGGRSSEHEISVITGQEVLGAFDTKRYAPFPVYIDMRGRWFVGDELRKKEIYKGLPGSLESLKEVALLPIPNSGAGGKSGLTVIGGKKGFSLFGGKPEVIPVDVFFPTFHGQFGEDGCIQGLLEFADVAYTGCGVLASSLAMNKYLCKLAVHAQGIPVLPGIVVKKSAAQKNLPEVRSKILATRGLDSFPLFVKPLSLGSSIGVSVAEDAAGLDAGLAKVFLSDTDALIEPCITEKLEVNVSVRDYPSLSASVTETPVATGTVLSYEDKYLRGGKNKAGGTQAQGMASLVRVIDPPDLAETVKNMITEYAISAYKTIGCSGVVRFDFMIDTSTNNIYFNELNPLPGSLAHYLWEKSKPPVLYPELLHDMVSMALARRELASSLKRDTGFHALFR